MIAGEKYKTLSLIHNYAFENGQFHIETSNENLLFQLLTSIEQELAKGKREMLPFFYLKN